MNGKDSTYIYNPIYCVGVVVCHQHIKILLKIPTGKIHQFQKLKCTHRFIVFCIVHSSVYWFKPDLIFIFCWKFMRFIRVKMMIVNQNSQDTKHGRMMKAIKSAYVRHITVRAVWYCVRIHQRKLNNYTLRLCFISIECLL